MITEDDKISPKGTSVHIECISNTNFIEEINSFEAVCKADGWHVSHPIGCMMPKSIQNGDEEKLICKTLTTDKIRCKYPLCKEPNGTESTLPVNSEEHYIIHHKDPVLTHNEVDTKLTVACKDFCMLH